MMNVCICGGGSLGHVLSGWLAAKEKAKVRVLTGKPDLWQDTLTVTAPDCVLTGVIDAVSADPSEVIPDSDVIIICHPGFMIRKSLESIAPYLKEDAYVGCVFSSTGFFFEATKVLKQTQPLWGFQRVPFIARVSEYGRSARLLGYKSSYYIAVENVTAAEKQAFAGVVEDWFERPVYLLNNYYEASLTNSNPLLHTSRLFTMFGGKNEGKSFSRMIRFYEEWTDEASALLIKMDDELFELLKVLPVSPSFLPRILDYYESHDPGSLTRKLSSIESFKGIESPMVRSEEGWVPDYKSRYFTEDFMHGLKYVWQLAHENSVSVPNIDMVYEWGCSKLKR